MKNELTPATERAPTGFGGSGIELRSFDDAARFCKAVHCSGLAPSGFKSAEAIMVALQAGAEIGLPPMQAIQSVAVINGRPTLWGDAVPALLWSAGFKLEESIDGGVASCTVIRPDGTRITRSFSEDDAKAANLLGKQGPWAQYKNRMLQMRARSWACRDGAADVLRGMVIREEAHDYHQGPDRAKDITNTAGGPDPLIAQAHHSGQSGLEPPKFLDRRTKSAALPPGGGQAGEDAAPPSSQPATNHQAIADEFCGKCEVQGDISSLHRLFEEYKDRLQAMPQDIYEGDADRPFETFERCRARFSEEHPGLMP